MDDKEKEAERKERIYNEIIVDAYGEGEVKASWFIHMQDTLSFPFKAQVMIKKRNGASVKQRVGVLGLGGDERFGNDMVVEVAYTEDIFVVPLKELTNIRADEEILEPLNPDALSVKIYRSAYYSTKTNAVFHLFHFNPNPKCP